MESEDSEASRLSRFFLYKQRERLPVKKAQIKAVLDKGNDEKNKELNAVERSKKILEDSMGLSIESYTTENKKSAQKFFVVRNTKYPENSPIPFTETQKRAFGILTYVFFIINFAHPLNPTLHDIIEGLEFANLNEDIGLVNDIEILLKQWTNQEYLTTIKGEAKEDIRYTFGPRFEIEIGRKKLEELARQIIAKNRDDDVPVPNSSQH